MQADGVYRYGFPRSDLKVVVDGVTIKPALALWRLGGVQARGRSSDDHGRSRRDESEAPRHGDASLGRHPGHRAS